MSGLLSRILTFEEAVAVLAPACRTISPSNLLRDICRPNPRYGWRWSKRLSPVSMSHGRRGFLAHEIAELREELEQSGFYTR